jgi:hypothetical protein
MTPRILVAAFLAVALAGCGQPPQMKFTLPWGGGYTSWGYTSQSSTVNGLMGVVYMPNKDYCNAARTNEIYNLATRAGWKGSPMGLCQPLVLTMGGPGGYWAFALDSLPGGFGFAFSSRDMCESLRQGFTGVTAPLASACAPVSLRLLDTPAD